MLKSQKYRVPSSLIVFIWISVCLFQTGDLLKKKSFKILEYIIFFWLGGNYVGN